MSDQQTIERIQQEVVSSNKDRLYQATLKEVNMNNFNKAKAIYKSSSGLDNISEELKTIKERRNKSYGTSNQNYISHYINAWCNSIYIRYSNMIDEIV